MVQKASKHDKANIKDLQNLTFAETAEFIKQSLEPFGCYQFAIVLLLSLNCAVIAIANTIPAFYAYTPNNFTCSMAESNETCVQGCEDYKFYDSYTSVVTEWSLVCDRKYLMAMSTTIFYAGVTVSSFVTGILADFWGRRRVMLLCLSLQGLLSAGIYVAETFTAFTVIRFLQGFFVMGIENGGFALMQELTPPRKATLTSALYSSCWGFGTMFLGIASYFIPNWRILQLVVTVPTAFVLIFSWTLPESPTWYLTKNDTKSALKTVIKMANKNGIVFKPQISNEENDVAFKPGKLRDLFTNQILLKHLVVMMLCWFSATISFYGILFYMTEIPGGLHLNFIIGGLLETILPFIGIIFFSSPRFGRKYSMIIFQYVTAVFCVILGLLTLASDDNPWKFYFTILSALFAKVLASLCYNGAFTYGIELFPTVVRSSAFGLCGIAANVGSLIAPQILLLSDLTYSSVPMLVIAIFKLIGGTVIFAVPETLNKPLPNTMENVREHWELQSLL